MELSSTKTLIIRLPFLFLKSPVNPCRRISCCARALQFVSHSSSNPSVRLLALQGLQRCANYDAISDRDGQCPDPWAPPLSGSTLRLEERHSARRDQLPS